MATELKHIQHRHGTATQVNNNWNKVFNEELVIVDSGDTTPDGTAVYFRPANGSQKRLRNADEPIVLESKQVKTANIDDGAVEHDQLADNSVYSNNIAYGQVTEDKLGSRCVSSDKLANESVESRHLSAGIIGWNNLNATLKTKVNDKMENVPVVSSLTDASDFATGQLFIYGIDLLRKTANSYSWIRQVGQTGGTVSGMTPRYVGQLMLINSKLYIGKTTNQGGFVEITIDELRVKLSQESSGFRADKTNKEIYDAVSTGKDILISQGSVSDGVYNRWYVDYVFTQSVAGGTLYGAIIHNVFGSYRTLAEADSFAYFTEYEP